MAKRGEWHEAARIIRAAHPEWSERRIAEFLGVSKGAVWKALNPERAREFARRSNAKRGRRSANGIGRTRRRITTTASAARRRSAQLRRAA
jgi:hypothetical protein